ncbi:MAG: AmmeMemoRadiSam system radical SAM enzyme, partial [Planctomycetota bacterium]
SYTEPIVFMEYMLDIAAHTKPKGIKNVVATAGYVEEKPLKELCKSVDAITVGLKAFTQECYKKLTDRSLAPVLKAIETIKKEGVWLELTNLIVPTYNDDKTVITEMCKWIKKNLGSQVPLHFARFVPMHKLKNLPQTPVKSLEEARKIALAEGIEYVYISNVAPHEGNDTYCPKCKKAVIKRVGLKILENNLKDGKCPSCGHKIPGVWK